MSEKRFTFSRFWCRQQLICLTAGLLTSLLAACGGRDPAVEQTIVAQHGTLTTEIAIQRVTATFAADQLQITAEYFGTEARAAEFRSTDIVNTLEALGVNVGGAQQITPVILSPTPRPGEQSGDGGTPGGITRVAPTSEAPAGSPTPPPAANNDSNTIVIDPNLPNLSNVSVSSAVGDNDCATAPGASFPTGSQILYAVGTANKFTAGTTVTFTWLKEGQSVLTADWTWDDPVDGRCVWYGFTPEDFPFDPGTYTVNFESSGAAIAQPVTFTLADETGETETVATP